jgi:hypothetical protein
MTFSYHRTPEPLTECEDRCVDARQLPDDHSWALYGSQHAQTRAAVGRFPAYGSRAPPCYIEAV